MAATPLTDAERQQIRDLHAAGLGCAAIAREIGRDRSTISVHARAMGLTFDRAQTRAATQARVDDARDRRSKLALDLLADAERLRTQLWTPCIVHSFGGRNNSYNEHELPEPPFRDKRDIMNTAALALDKHMRLLDFDQRDGADEVASLLGTLFDNLRTKHGNGEDDTPPE
jgi:hypothetical protein